jgi:mRNA interferase YafQ
MRDIIRQHQFKADLKRISRSSQHTVDELLKVITSLANDIPLAKKYCDHPLSGKLEGFRECHIKPDWLLIYRLEPQRLILVRTGSHSQLFKR